MTIRIDQLSEAIVAAPGVSVSVLDATHGSDSTTSGTFVTCDSAVTAVAFMAPLAGLYSFELSLDCFTSALATARFRMVIDKGLSTERVTPDTATWDLQFGGTTERKYKTYIYDFTLAAGSHTFEIQWRRASGSGTLSVSSGGSVQCKATLVSGSGAGGTITATRTMVCATTDFSTTSSSWVTVTDDSGPVTLSVTTAANERVFFPGKIAAYSSVTVCWYKIGVGIDGADPVDPNIVDMGGDDTYTSRAVCLPSILIATAGSHTLTLKAKRCAGSGTARVSGGSSENSPPISPTSFQAVQYRGGLVPIRQDGVDKVGQPRALDFIGAGVYQVTEGTGSDAGVAKIQLNQAITAPGVSLEMLRKTPGGTYTTTSGSFGPISSPAMDGTFVAPVAGTYMVSFTPTCYATSAGTYATFRLNFDGGNYVGVDDNSWELNLSTTIHASRTFFGTVVLAAGSHIISPEWKRSYVSGTCTIDTDDSVQVWGTLVTGSGAGGTIVSRATKTADQPTVGGGSLTLLTELSHTIQTAASENVDLEYTIITKSAGADHTAVAYRVDSGSWIQLETENVTATGYWTSLSGSRNISLAAGVHTIDFAAGATSTISVVGGSGPSYLGLTWTSRTVIKQYRGGLVPVRKDGTSVIDTPAAFNFTGPNVNVTNIGGTANISLSGVTGTIQSTPWWSRIPADDSPTVTPTLESGNYTVGCRFSVYKAGTRITGVSFYSLKTGSHTIRCGLWKYTGSTLLKSVDVACAGPGRYDGYFSAPYEVSAGEAPQTQFYATMWETSGTNYTDIPSSPFGNQPYSVRTHQYWDRSVAYAIGDAFPNTNHATQTYPVDPIVEIAGDPAGQVIPENIPILEYSTTSVVNVKAAPGASTSLGMVLNNGVRYTATSPLTVNLTLSGLGGLDTGSEAISTWYYVYAVPSGIGYGFSTLCSVSPPSTGPTGYSIWRYLGAIRNDGSSNVVKFQQAGSTFMYLERAEAASSAALGTTLQTTKVTLSMSDVVPVTAVSMFASMEARHGVSAGGDVYFQVFVDSQTNPVLQVFDQNGSIWESYYHEGTIPMPTTPKQVGYRSYITFGSPTIGPQHVYTLGWQDGNLAGLASQLQAKYTPDTAQPQMLWRGNSRVDVQASPGQPSTVLLTLQDGKQRSFGPVLTWDPSTGVADGGLDTGTEASSTWYYLYMVPKSSADDLLHVRGSVSAPPTGPTGYTNWRYIGAVRNDGSSNILNFKHTGSVFEYATNTQPVPFTGAGSADVSLQILALANHVPATTQQTHLGAYVQVSSAGAMYFFVDGLADITTGTTRWNTSHARLGGNAANEVDHLNAMVPTPGATKQVGYFRETAYAECRIDCFGWLDGYLSSAAGLGGGGPIGNTLNGAYNSGGPGAGRAITVNAGAVEMNALGSNALKLDGYLTLQEISTPASMLNKGLVYSGDDSGDTELYYRDDKSHTVQATKDGYLYVRSLQSRFVSPSAPTDGYGLTWNAGSSQWESSKPVPGGAAGGDLSGTYPRPTVAKIQGYSVATTAPQDGYALVYKGTTAKWTPESHLKYGVFTGPTIDSYGIQTPGVNNTLALWSNKVSGSGNISIEMMANVQSASIDTDHKILSLGWRDNLGVEHESVCVKDGKLEFSSAATANIFGTSADGASAIGVTIGSDNVFSTTGSKMLSIKNGGISGTEKAYIGFDGYAWFAKPTLQNRNMSMVAPADGYTMVWNSSAGVWSAQIQDGYRIQNRKISSSAPADGYALVWNNSVSSWEPQRIVRGAVEQELVSTGTETFIALSEPPFGAQSIQMFRNGNRMRRVTAVPTTTSQWRYNAALQRVEFLATGGVEEYIVWYLK